MNKLEIHFATPLTVTHLFEAAPQIFSRLTIKYQGFTITAQGDVMYNISVDNFVEMQVSYVDRGGNPATIDGLVGWSVSDPTILSITIDATDSTIVTVTPLGPLGNVQLTATADADLGAGTRNLVTLCDITIVSGEAVAGTIEPVGSPSPIPSSKPQRKS